MAHFAKVVNEIVTSVIVADQDWVNALDGEWVQTSYNTYGGVHSDNKTPLRKNYAGIGFTYDSDRDAFYAPQLYPSWTLNEDSCIWEPPTPEPNYFHGVATWNESSLSWDKEYDEKPYASWIWDDSTETWLPPTAYPDNGKLYDWDEDTTSWVEIS